MGVATNKKPGTGKSPGGYAPAIDTIQADRQGGMRVCAITPPPHCLEPCLLLLNGRGARAQITSDPWWQSRCQA